MSKKIESELPVVWLTYGVTCSLIGACFGATLGVVYFRFLWGVPLDYLMKLPHLWGGLALACAAGKLVPMYKLSVDTLAGFDNWGRWRRVKWEDCSIMEVTYRLVIPHLRVKAGNITYTLPFVGSRRRIAMQFLENNVTTSVAQAMISRTKAQLKT